MMKQEDEVILERRLTTLEMGIDTIISRLDKQDRRAAWWVNGIFAMALATGGIYLDAYINKEDKAMQPTAIVHTTE